MPHILNSSYIYIYIIFFCTKVLFHHSVFYGTSQICGRCLIYLKGQESTYRKWRHSLYKEATYGNFRESQSPLDNSIFLTRWSEGRLVSHDSSLKTWLLESLIYNEVLNENAESILGHQIIENENVC